MDATLLELAQNYFLGSTVRQLSTAFDEPEERLSAALRSVLPLVLGGLLARVQEPGGATELATWAQQVHQRNLLSDLSSLLTGLRTPPTAAPATGSLPARGADMMRTLLGAAYGPALATISQQASVPPTTVSNLFSVAVTAVLGLLGRHRAQLNLDTQSLGSYLGSQRAAILDALATLPAGLRESLAHLVPSAPAANVAPGRAALSPDRANPIPMKLSETGHPGAPNGAASTPSAPTAATQPVSRAAPPQPVVRSALPAPVASRRWVWLLLALGVAVGGYWGLSRRSPVASDPVTTPVMPTRPAVLASRVPTPTGQYEAATGTYRYEVGAATTLRLPTDTSLTVGSRSTEAQLWQLLTASTQSLTSDKTLSGIILDRVYFDPGQATLTAASRAQLANLAALLAAFPHATLKVGGFTDNQGEAENNLLLSADRANAVRKSLLAQGVAPTRVAAQGYGQTHPVASNTTPVGQAQNRRVAVLLTSR